MAWSLWPFCDGGCHLGPALEARIGSDCSWPLVRYLDVQRLSPDRYYTLQLRAATRRRPCWPRAMAWRRAHRQLTAFCAAIERAYGLVRTRAEAIACRNGVGRRWDDWADDLLVALARLRFYDSDAVRKTMAEIGTVVDFVAAERARHLLSRLWGLWGRDGAVPARAITWAVAVRQFLYHYGGKLEMRAELDECATTVLSRVELQRRPRRKSRTCVICTEDMLHHESVVFCQGRADCGREFHQVCLAAWVQSRVESRLIPRCPLCNRVWVATPIRDSNILEKQRR